MTIQIKPIERYFHVVLLIMQYNVIPTFRSSNTGNISLQLVAQPSLCVRVTKLCCPYYHPRKQLQDLMPKVEPSSTSCNMLLQLATLKLLRDKLLAGVVIRATKLCNLQSNNVGRQVACGDGNTGNKALQLAKQQCYATSCKETLPVLPDLYGGYRF